MFNMRCNGDKFSRENLLLNGNNREKHGARSTRVYGLLRRVRDLKLSTSISRESQYRSGSRVVRNIHNFIYFYI